MKKGFIYITTNKLNGLKYVGKKYYFYRNGKESNWKEYLGSSKLLLADVEKYGKENFERIIIDEADNEDDLNNLEIQYINELNAVESDQYYNLSNGVDKWFTNDDSIKRGLETRKKWTDDKKLEVSKKLKNRFNNMSEEKLKMRSEKISKAHKNNPKFRQMRSRVQKRVCSSMSDDEKINSNNKKRESMKKYHENWTDDDRIKHIEDRRDGLFKAREAYLNKIKNYRENTFLTFKHQKTGEVKSMTIIDAEKFLECSRETLQSIIRGDYNRKHNNGKTYKKWTLID